MKRKWSNAEIESWGSRFSFESALEEMARYQ